MNTSHFILDEFQQAAIDHLDHGSSVLVCAPTGTGKTVIADHMVATALAAGHEVVYTAPIKALSNQKFRDYCRLHGDDSVGLVTGDLVIRRDAPCRVMTTEILRNMLLASEPTGALQHVILDEIHFLDDRERGTTWEEVLIYLPKRVQVLGLSATLSNLDEFARWMSTVRGTPTSVVLEPRRAVPLELQIFNRHSGLVSPEAFDKAHRRWRKEFQKTKKTRHAGKRAQRGRAHPQNTKRRGSGRHGPSREPRTGHLDVIARLQKGFLPCLYFVFSRGAAEACAFSLLRQRPNLLSASSRRRCRAILEQALPDTGESVLTPALRAMYETGIGFHHAGLHVQLKALVERLYEARLIQVLYCTSTFALGINMPARTVVFDELRKYDGHGFAPLTTRQFMQKAGRAGRRGMDKLGHVVIRMDHDIYDDIAPHIARYRAQNPEKVRSSFNLSFNSVINLLARHSEDRIRELTRLSFLSFHDQELASQHLGRANSLERHLRRSLDLPPDSPLPKQLPPSLRKKINKAAHLRAEAEHKRDRCWWDFQRKVTFLKDVGYLAPNGAFNAGAQALRHLQINEVFATELFLSGLLDSLSPPLLFGLLCSMVQSFKRGVKSTFRMTPELKAVSRQAHEIRVGHVVTGAEVLTGFEVEWDPELLPFGCCWAEGWALDDLLPHLRSRTDISGDLVGAFRRSRDLMGQVAMLYQHDPQRQEALRTLLRETVRDEVEVID